MFGNITNEKLLDQYYDGEISKVPTTDYLAPPPTPPAALIKSIKAKGSLTFNIPTSVPDTGVWLENLAGPHLSWLRALLTSSTIVRGSSCVDNPIHYLLAPCTGQKVIIRLQGATPIGIDVFGAICYDGPQKENFKAVKINQFHVGLALVGHGSCCPCCHRSWRMPARLGGFRWYHVAPVGQLC